MQSLPVSNHQFSASFNKHPNCLKTFPQLNSNLSTIFFVPSTELSGDPNDGELYAVTFENNNATVKPIFKDKHGLLDFELISQNWDNNKQMLCGIANEDNVIYICTINQDLQIANLQSLNGHCDFITALKVNPVDRSSLLSSSADGSLILWNIEEKSSLKQQFKGHKGKVTSCVWSNQDKNIFYSTSMDGTLREWNIDDLYSKGKVIYNSDCGITCLTRLKDQPILLIGLESGRVIELDARKKEESFEILQLEEGIKAISVNLEGKIVVATDSKRYYIKDRQATEPASLGRESEGFISDIFISDKDNHIFITSSKKRIEIDTLTS